MCTRNFDPLKDWPEKDRKRVIEYLKANEPKDSTDDVEKKAQK
jgi:hypothetical protein